MAGPASGRRRLLRFREGPGNASDATGGPSEEVKLSDVRWGVIFRMGWKMVAFCKYLALIYCLMTLLQNGMNLGMSQLVGKSPRNSPVRRKS